MESELLKEWTAEERREEAINTSLSIVIELLEDKFDVMPQNIKLKLHEIKDPDMLKTLSKKVMKVTTLEEFEQHLERLQQ